MFDNSAQLIELVKKVLYSQYFAVLASFGQGQPYSNLVAFAFTEDLKSIIFTTNRNTQKYKNIKANKRVSLLVDNRTNHTTDLKKALAITIIGSATEEADRDGRFRAIFLTRLPALKQFVNDLDSALFVIRISEFIIAGFTKTQRMLINTK